MKTRLALAGFLSIAGTLLAAVPFLFLLTVTACDLISVLPFHFRALIPLHLCPVPLIGGVLLAASSLIARRLRLPVILGTVVLLASLALCRDAAVQSSLAAGRLVPTGGRQVFAVVMLAGTYAALATLDLSGLRLIRRLYPKGKRTVFFLQEAPLCAHAASEESLQDHQRVG